MFANIGDAQYSRCILRNVTTDATPTELFLNGSNHRPTIPPNATMAFTALIVARRIGASHESAAYEIKGCIDNNAGSVALVGTITKTVIAEDTPAWDVTAEADASRLALIFKVTGEAGKTIRWVATVFMSEVGG